MTRNERYDSLDTEQASIGTQFQGRVIDVSAPPYNAPESGDGTAEVQQAIDDLPARGGSLVVPYPVEIHSTLDVTNREGVTFAGPGGDDSGWGGAHFDQGMGGFIGMTNGSPVIDATGSRGIRFESGFTVAGDASAPPNIGVLHARSQTQPQATGPTYYGAAVVGTFSLAGIYNVSTELGVIAGNSVVAVDNDSTSITGIYHTGDNDQGIISQFATINPVDSITLWTHRDSRLANYSSVAGGEIVRLRSSAMWSTIFSGNYLRTGAAEKPAVRLDMDVGNIIGPIVFEANNHETVGAENTLLKSGQVASFRGLQFRDNNYNGSGDVIDLSSGGFCDWMQMWLTDPDNSVSVASPRKSEIKAMNGQALSGSGASEVDITLAGGATNNITGSGIYVKDLTNGTAGFV